MQVVTGSHRNRRIRLELADRLSDFPDRPLISLTLSSVQQHLRPVQRPNPESADVMHAYFEAIALHINILWSSVTPIVSA